MEKTNQFYDQGRTDRSVTPRIMKLISVTIFLETDEINIFPLYGKINTQEEKSGRCYRI
jgi:hypothetical protein